MTENKAKLPRFDGTSNVIDWIEEIAILFDTRRTHEEDRLRWAIAVVFRNARTAVEMLEENAASKRRNSVLADGEGKVVS